MDEEGLTQDQVIRLRDEAVQEFFEILTGVEKSTIRVLGEELQDVEIPSEAVYPTSPGSVDLKMLDVSEPEVVRSSLCRLASLSSSTPLADAVRRYRLLWDMNRWLIKRPMSLSQIIQQVRTEVAERRDAPDDRLLEEVESALVLGAALPDEVAGTLRLRTHRFVRGGWKFHRCTNPSCGKVYPMGEEYCQECHFLTAPLYLCRNCGADYLRVVGELDDGKETLRPSAIETDGPEWMVYQPDRFESPAVTEDDDDQDEAEAPERPRARRPSRHAGASPPPTRTRWLTRPMEPEVQPRLELLFAQGDPPAGPNTLRLLREAGWKPQHHHPGQPRDVGRGQGAWRGARRDPCRAQQVTAEPRRKGTVAGLQ